jgi:hypothetical protein
VSRAETIAAAKKRQADHGGTYRAALAFVMAEREAAEWNALYPVGTPVIMSPYTGCPESERLMTVTRSVAWALPSGQASVMIEGKSGGYGLAWVKPIKAVSP